MLVNCVLLLLLLVVHPLPQCDYVAGRVSQIADAKLEPYELSQPLLSVLLFNWVSPILSDCRREHQVSRSDLRVPPDNCQVSSAYARFSMGAKPGQPLVRQLFSVFKVDLAIQIVYTFYNTFSDYIQPYLMQRVLRFIGRVLGGFVAWTAVRQQQWQSRGISMEIRNVLVASLTQKTLRRRAHESKSKDDSSRDSSDGRVYNILTADVSRVNKTAEMFGSVLFSPCQLIIGCFYMYQLLGIAGLFGTAMIVGVMAVGQRLIVRAKRIEAQIGRFNDQRLETISEVIHGSSLSSCLGGAQSLSKLSALNVRCSWRRCGRDRSFNGRLDGETTFTAIAVFRVLQRAIFWMPGGVSHAISIYVSLKRIDEYLHEDDVQPAGERVEAAGHDVGFSQAQLVWKRADDSAAAEEGTPLLLHGRQPEDSQAFALRNLTVRFPQGGLTIIGGPTGSGKSSLLSALVGDMTVVSANGEPWLRNATIRDNVLFGELYIRDRYEEVLRMCGLKPDLRTFVAGDQSEVGERGITLSGGQKQRVALARAIYSSRRILLIDDCLSAVDSHTAKHILHTCLLSQSPLMHVRRDDAQWRDSRKGNATGGLWCAFDDVAAASDGESQGEQAPAVQRQALEDPMPRMSTMMSAKVAADTPAAAGSQTGMQEARQLVSSSKKKCV
ncbi:hypothetical protein DL89DRAFT_310800 [Linderina pennispora]|uniref:P-loop containing nucleoside triphosphate hydrolase protein n=1 Tax=Linderina pennispora TaxID=61395 RepID=A0A1Y1VWZ7_9FUNG|nr:uncharacterized protein DL89DRAFT_310800 [Linderina pennispora]ORX65506.1 hypothetical protein DL89DRAFT_310800 [Linderina pennispora]